MQDLFALTSSDSVTKVAFCRKQHESSANARKQGKKSKKNSGEDCSPPAAKQPRIDGAAAAAASAEMPKASKSRSKRKRSGDRSALLSSVFV